MTEKPSDKGGLLLLLAIVAFLAATNGIAYFGSGSILTGSGTGVASATALAGLLVAGAVGGAMKKLAEAAKSPALRWLAPVAVFVGAAAFTWFLVIPMMHRAGTSFGYEGTYRVTYSGGRTEMVEASVLNQKEWSKWMGGYLGFAVALFASAVWQVRNRLRTAPAGAGAH
ncbi:MAG: hypothetical protein WBP79_08570 [Candidatus Acidiferrales bacterium]